MDLRKYRKAGEDPSASGEQMEVLPSGSREAAGPSQDDHFKIPSLPLPWRHSPGPKPAMDLEELWRLRQLWQYMTLPFTITMPLRHMAPYGLSWPMIEQAYLQGSSAGEQKLCEIQDSSAQALKDEKWHFVPPRGSKRKLLQALFDQQKALEAFNSRQSQALLDNMKLPLTPSQNHWMLNNKCETAEEDRNINTPQRSAPCTNFCTEHKTEPSNKRRLEEELNIFNPEGSVEAATSSIPEEMPCLVLCSNPEELSKEQLKEEILKQAKILNFLNLYSHNNEAKPPEPPALEAAKKIRKPRCCNKIRLAEDRPKERPSKKRRLEEAASTPSSIPKMVFPMYDKNKTKKACKRARTQSVDAKKATAASREEIWTVKEKTVPADEKQHSNVLVLKKASPQERGKQQASEGRKETAPASIEEDALPLETAPNDKPLKLATAEVVVPIENGETSTVCAPDTSQEIPEDEKKDAMQRLSRERIKKAYNLHETLLDKLGGTVAMPERKIEIDSFRRDLILELIGKQFGAENEGELKDSIMGYLGDQEKVQTYVEIVENIIQESDD